MLRRHQTKVLRTALMSVSMITLLAACGNVRFTADSSNSGVSANGANPGNDGSTPGDGHEDGNDGSTPGSPPSGPRDVNYSMKVPPAKNQVDFLLVIDNSASMIAVQQRMAASMTTLAAQMNNLNIDWQMCLTTTTDMNIGGQATGTGTHTCTGPYCTGNYSGGQWHWGVSLPWSNGNYVLNKAGLAADPNIFNNSIPRLGAGDPGTGDERGIKAAFNHFANWKGGLHNTKNCYRSGSSVAVILLSDEDERSVAGDCSRVNTDRGDKEVPACRNYSDNSIRVLEFQDQPANLISQANSVFGDATRFTFNSIIADTDACQNQLNQNASFIKDGVPYYSPHYTGTVYKKASELTGGGISSLCSSDLQLNLFSTVVVNRLDQISLECAPVAGSLKVMVNGTLNTSNTVTGAVLSFSPALVENQTVTLAYRCAQ